MRSMLTCGHSPKISKMIWRKIDQKKRYDKLELIGEGEYAKVYSAEDTKLGRSVAVKRVRKKFLDDKEKLSRYWKGSPVTG